MRLLMDKICITTKIYHYIVNHESSPTSPLLLLYKLLTDPLIHLAMLINRPEADAFGRDPVASSVLTCTFFDLLLFPLLLSSSKAHTSPLIYRSDIGTLDTSIRIALRLIAMDRAFNFSLNIPASPLGIPRFAISAIALDEYFLRYGLLASIVYNTYLIPRRRLWDTDVNSILNGIDDADWAIAIKDTLLSNDFVLIHL